MPNKVRIVLGVVVFICIALSATVFHLKTENGDLTSEVSDLKGELAVKEEERSYSQTQWVVWWEEAERLKAEKSALIADNSYREQQGALYVESLDWIFENLRYSWNKPLLTTMGQDTTPLGVLKRKVVYLDDPLFRHMVESASLSPGKMLMQPDDFIETMNYVIGALEVNFGSSIRDEGDPDAYQGGNIN